MGWKDLVEEREDLDVKLLDSFLNTVMTSTIQTEYYSKPEKQVKHVFDVHSKMLSNQREVYALTLLLPINDIHKQLVMFNLLKSGKDLKTLEHKTWEDRLIRISLNYLPTNRSYKTFKILQLNKVNNSRTRTLARDFLSTRRKLDFETVKYSKYIHDMVVHNHIKLEKINPEVWEFLFKKKPKIKESKLLKSYVEAKTDKEKVYELPYSVALGFKEFHKIPDKEFYEKIKKKMTHGEKLKTQSTSEKHGVEVKIDIDKYPPVKMLKYFRQYPEKSNEEAFKKSCKRVSDKIPFRFDSITVVLDNSKSMFGSRVKKFHPISVSESVSQILSELTDNYKLFDTGDSDDLHAEKPRKEKRPFMVKLVGSTDLSVVARALKDEPELLVILSDGYENQPAGLVYQIIESYLKKVRGKTMIVHINPVYAPEAEEIRKLHDGIMTLGVRDTRQVGLLLLIILAHYKKTKEIKKVLKDLKKRVEIEPKKKKVKKNEG